MQIGSFGRGASCPQLSLALIAVAEGCATTAGERRVVSQTAWSVIVVSAVLDRPPARPYVQAIYSVSRSKIQAAL